jgi:Protein of unknown function (DUF3572)
MAQRPEFVPRLKTGEPRVATPPQRGARQGGPGQHIVPRLSRDEAETIALRGLGFMAEDEDRLGRFMGDTGVDPDDLRQHAGSPQVLTAVLDYLSRDESQLLMFAANADIPPEHIVPALAILSGENRDGVTDGGSNIDPNRPSKIMKRRDMP